MAGTQRNSPNSLNIRRTELEIQRIALEERLRPLRLQLMDLTDQRHLLVDRVTEDRHRLRDATNAAEDRGNTSAINRNLKQSNLALAIREEAYKIKQHYDNNTGTSELASRSDARVEKLHERLEKRRSQAFNALIAEEERAKNALFASRAAHALINREIYSLKSTLRELETALSAIVDEEARLNIGRGRKRKLRATHKRGKKGGAWTAKYKRSINCNRPRGFSKKQYCK
jgi:chromosome segregation ATPase